jgi:hypothetical protein
MAQRCVPRRPLGHAGVKQQCTALFGRCDREVMNL